MISKLGIIAPTLVLAVLSIGGLAAQEVTLPLKAIQVTHFTPAEGLAQGQDFFDAFYDGLLKQLPKAKVASQVLGEGDKVAEAEAANSVVVEGKILEVKHKSLVGIVRTEVNLYRASDHQMVKNFVAEVPYKPSPLNTDKIIGNASGGRLAYEIQRQLKKLTSP
jgi:hypothetical protein